MPRTVCIPLTMEDVDHCLQSRHLNCYVWSQAFPHCAGSAGLAAYIFTKSIPRSWRVSESLEYGLVGVNEGIISTEVRNSQWYSPFSKMQGGFSFVLSQNFSNFDQFYKKILTSTIPNKRTIKTFHGGFNETNLMFQMSVQCSIHKVKLE